MKHPASTAFGGVMIGLTMAGAQAASSVSTDVGTLNKISHFVAAALPAQAPSGLVSAKAVHPLSTLAPNTAGMCTTNLAAAGNGRKLWAIYMIGSDLEGDNEFGTQNLIQLVTGWQQLAARDNIDIVVAFGGVNKEGWHGIKYANIAQLVADAADGVFGNSSTYLFSDPQADMGKQATFESFLTFVNANFGQDSRRFLTFWDHGSSYNYEPGIGPDQNTNTVLGVSEINNAMAATNSCYHLIGFDACLMASMETAVAMQDFGQYMVASEEEEPGHGWNYVQVLDALSSQPSNLAVGQAMVDSFVNDANFVSPGTGKTLSVLDLSQVRNTVQALESTSSLLAAGLNGGGEQAAIRAFYNAQQFAGKISVDPSLVPSQTGIDLKDFITLVAARSGDSALKQSIAATTSAVDKLVAYSRTDGSRPHATGVFVPPLDMNSAFAAEQVAAGLMNPGWGQVINAYATLEQRSTAPVIGTIDSQVAGAGLSYVSARDGSVDTATAVAMGAELGVKATVSSPYLGNVSEIIGKVDTDGGLIMLGEQFAYPVSDSSYFAPQWNGRVMALVSGNDVVYLPLFISQAGAEIELNTVIKINRPGEPGPILGLLKVVPDNGGFSYDISVIETYGDRFLLGKSGATIEPNDTVTIFTTKTKPGAATEVMPLVSHTFAVTPVIADVPVTNGNYGYTFAGYSVGDLMGSGAVQAVPVADRLFNWASLNYPSFDLTTDSKLLYGYYARCNATQTSCIGVKDGYGWYYNGTAVQNVGTVDQWLPQAAAAGF